MSRQGKRLPLSAREQTRLVLAVDFSRSALIAGLYIDDDDIFEEHRLMKDIHIGASAPLSKKTFHETTTTSQRRRELACHGA